MSNLLGPPHTNMHKKRSQHSQHSTKRQEANKPTNQQINKPTDRQVRKQANNTTESNMHTNNSHSDLVMVRSLKNPKIPWVTIPLTPSGSPLRTKTDPRPSANAPARRDRCSGFHLQCLNLRIVFDDLVHTHKYIV